MISDQLQQCQSCFTSQQGNFEIKFYLQQRESNNILILEIKNKHSPQYYQLNIDHTYIQQHSELAFFFETPQDIFYTLTQLYQELNISIEGTISFEMKMNASKLKKKILIIQLNKYEQDQHSFMQLKFEKLSSQVHSQLNQRQSNIRMLSRKSQEQEHAVELLKEQLIQLKKEQQVLTLENKRQYFKINTLTKENDFQRQEIFDLKRALELAISKINNIQFFCFYQNPHWHYYGVLKTQNSFKIVRKDNDNSWCTFIYNIPLRKDNINGFKIKQSKSSAKNIMYGLGTRQLFGVPNAYKDVFSVAYSASSGNLWEDGIARKIGPQVNDGQVITMDIDSQSGRVLWMVDQTKIVKIGIPEMLIKRQLFLFLHTYNIGDELQLLIF